MEGEVRYAGFFDRMAATIIDWLWLYGIVYAVLFLYIGISNFYTPAHFVVEWLIPFLVVIAFWKLKQATPGKMLFRLRIVDARTGGRVPLWRLVVRYLAYFISMLPLGLGFIWVAWDERKQGWHDKIAGTVILRGNYSPS